MRRLIASTWIHERAPHCLMMMWMRTKEIDYFVCSGVFLCYLPNVLLNQDVDEDKRD
jgi:hypothetical protein